MDARPPAPAGPHRRRRIALALALAGVIGLVATSSYMLAADRAMATLTRQASDRLALYAISLEAVIERFRYLPVVLAQAEPIQQLLADPHDPARVDAANRYLEGLNATTGASALYVMLPNGHTPAASNWNTAVSFVGYNYSFRPYFQDAVSHGEGRYYAIGTTSGVPGYFLSHRIASPDGRLAGVAVVKIELEPLEANWSDAGEGVAIADDNGIIFLTSRSGWRFRTTRPLDAGTRALLTSTRQYGLANLSAPPLVSPAAPMGAGGRKQLVRIADAGGDPGLFIQHRRPLPEHGWSLLHVTPYAEVRTAAGTVATAATLAALALVLVGAVALQRRQMVKAKLEAHQLLEQRVAQRTQELSEANMLLQTEVQERIRAERELRLAQDGLVQAAKLASLGQALAGVAHEINQPLAALRTYMASLRLLVERGERTASAKTFDAVTSMLERMTALTGHLKIFARKSALEPQATDLGQAVANALELVSFRLAAADIALDVARPARPVHVMGDPIRLEQVALNLMTNAVDALEGTARPRIDIRVAETGGRAVLTVSDTGAGIPPELQHVVFDPFFTTKEVGRGLGLGLSIAYGIVRDMDGAIEVASVPGEGTTFTVSLPLAETAPAPRRRAREAAHA